MQKVLIFQVGALGDTLVAIPAFNAIRHLMTHAQITLLHEIQASGAVNSEEVLRHTGLVDQFMHYKSGFGRLRDLAEIGRLFLKLQTVRFDTVIYLMPSTRSARSIARDRMFFKACGIKNLIGFHPFTPEEAFRFEASGRPAPVMHEAVAKLERLRRSGLEISSGWLEQRQFGVTKNTCPRVKRWLEYNRRKPEGALVAVVPASKMEAKAWPSGRFSELSRRISQMDAELVFLGSAKDRASIEEIIKSVGSGLNAAGLFSISESACLLANCAFAVGVDTGPMHLAASVGTRCVTLFSGRDHPGRWEPLGPGNANLRHEVDCAACYQEKCPIPEHPCMNGITVDEVWTEVHKLL